MTSKRSILLLVALLGIAGSLQALQIKIASVAPADSPYGVALNRIAADWERISGGEVQVSIYNNGVAGDQADVLRKIRIGELQGGIFASSGIAPMAKGVLSVSVPFLIQSDAELAYVMKDLSPILDRQLREQGFEAVSWADAGWLYLFTTKPLSSPAQLSNVRLALPPDENTLLDAFKTVGYHPVPLDIPDTLSGLNSGLVGAILSSPLLAAGYQWFGVAHHMLDLPIAPVLGTILIDERTWQRIPERYRSQFLAAARNAAETLAGQLKNLERNAIDTMRQYGLNVEQVSAASRNAWAGEFASHRAAIVSAGFDSRTVALIEKDLASYRAIAKK